MSRHDFPCVATEFPFLSHRKCRDMVFPCRDRVGCTWGSYVTTKHFCVAIELAKVEESMP